jgi:hypothetical protein
MGPAARRERPAAAPAALVRHSAALEIVGTDRPAEIAPVAARAPVVDQSHVAQQLLEARLAAPLLEMRRALRA